MDVLYFDCFSGASGDMILGALIDVGVPLTDVRRALGSLAIDPEVVWTERVLRAGISATKFCVQGEAVSLDAQHHEHDEEPAHVHAPAVAHAHGPGHPHRGDHHVHHHGHADDEPPRHVHRTLAEISRLIDRSALSASAKDRARGLFHRLAEVEGAIHGVPLEQVHLHEVGALDSIIDIVGAVFALEQLGVERIVSSPLNVGSGTIASAHGLYPVPAPATLRLLQGAPIYSGPSKAELVTPTGALLIGEYASDFGRIPPMTVKRIGYGAGTRDFADTPNVLRVLIGEAYTESDHRGPSHRVVVMEAEIDDMNPQIFGVVMEQLLADGAFDVFYTPIQMKKNRPGTLLTVVAPPSARERLAAIIFRETTTIGVRYRDMDRDCLDRETISVQLPFGTVRFKVARRNGKLLNASPEFDDCVRLASEQGKPVKEIQALATKAFMDRHASADPRTEPSA